MTASVTNEFSDGPFPRNFGDYELVAEIARGSMGVVYEAHDRLANRRVALKTMLASQREDPVRVERFLREARQAAAIHHENVVCVYRVGELEQQPYFTMALVDGEDLEEVAAEGALPPRRVAEIGLAIARARSAPRRRMASRALASRSAPGATSSSTSCSIPVAAARASGKHDAAIAVISFADLNGISIGLFLVLI